MSEGENNETEMEIEQDSLNLNQNHARPRPKIKPKILGDVSIDELRGMCSFLTTNFQSRDRLNPFDPKIWREFGPRNEENDENDSDSTDENSKNRQNRSPVELVLIFRHKILPNLKKILALNGDLEQDFKFLSQKLEPFLKRKRKFSKNESPLKTPEIKKANLKTKKPESTVTPKPKVENLPKNPSIERLKREIFGLEVKSRKIEEENHQIKTAIKINKDAFFKLFNEQKKKNLLLKHLAMCQNLKSAFARNHGNQEITLNGTRESDEDGIQQQFVKKIDKSTYTYENLNLECLKTDLQKQQLISELKERVKELKNEIERLKNEPSSIHPDQETFYDGF